MDAREYIEQLSLKPHPEGGFYRETYRSEGTIPEGALPSHFQGKRHYSTAIYFLLQEGDYSAFHRIKSDECWHFYDGGPLWIHVIEKDGNYFRAMLGNKIKEKQLLQFVVPADTWFASEPAEGTVFSLVGCTVSPGFDFHDFEMADGAQLSLQYPENVQIIKRLCK